MLCSLLIVNTTVTCGDLARATRVSTRQISDDLKTLQAAGRVELKRARYGYSVVRSEGKIPADQIGNYAPFDASTSHAICLGETPRGGLASGAAVAADGQASTSSDKSLSASDSAQPVVPVEASDESQGSTPPGSVSPLAEPTLEQAIRAARLAIPTIYEWVDKDTGEFKPGRVTTGRVQAVVAQMCGARWTKAVIARAIAAERKQQSLFAQETAKIAPMDDEALLKYHSVVQKALTRNTGKPREAFHQARFNIVNYERRKRGLDQPVDPNVKLTPEPVKLIAQPSARPVAPAVAPAHVEAIAPTLRHAFSEGWDGIEERARLAGLRRKQGVCQTA